WSTLGSGINNVVYALATSGSNVYAGGPPNTADAGAALAKWNGSLWFALGSGLRNIDGEPPVVQALAVSISNLYVGGRFDAVGTIVASSIAKWNGRSWSGLGSGVRIRGGGPATVRALAVLGSNLYVGGTFDTAGTNAANNIAKWDGSNWSALR